jgi:hypothetical protein
MVKKKYSLKWWETHLEENPYIIKHYIIPAELNSFLNKALSQEEIDNCMLMLKSPDLKDVLMVAAIIEGLKNKQKLNDKEKKII